MSKLLQTVIISALFLILTGCVSSQDEADSTLSVTASSQEKNETNKDTYLCETEEETVPETKPHDDRYTDSDGQEAIEDNIYNEEAVIHEETVVMGLEDINVHLREIIFAPIINAYALLKQSGLTQIAEEHVCDFSLPAVSQWMLDNHNARELPELVYAMTSFDRHYKYSQLVIGAQDQDGVSIIAIYMYRGFHWQPRAESVTFVGDGVSDITITLEAGPYHYGATVVTTTSRDARGTIEFFRRVSPVIGCGYLDKILTTNVGQRYRLCGHFCFCDEDYFGRDDIECLGRLVTEEEYLERVYRFGTSGHNIGNLFETRDFDLQWRRVF